jgi:hypothetical protein
MLTHFVCSRGSGKVAKYMHHETDRLCFLEARDGRQGAVAYARRTLRIYRAAVERGKDGRRGGYGSVEQQGFSLPYRQSARRASMPRIWLIASAGFRPFGHTSTQFRMERHRNRR